MMINLHVNFLEFPIFLVDVFFLIAQSFLADVTFFGIANFFLADVIFFGIAQKKFWLMSIFWRRLAASSPLLRQLALSAETGPPNRLT